MIMVTVEDMAERYRVIDKALDDGHCAISAAIGVLVVDSHGLAISVFRKMVATLSLIVEQAELPVYSAKDSRGAACIMVAGGTPGAIFLYGIQGEELLEGLGSDVKRPQ